MNRLPAALSRMLNRSIGTRIVALSLGLLLLVQVASFSAIQSGLNHHARTTLPEKLRVGERVLQSLIEHQAQTLSDSAALLAADYGFRSALASNDADTIASVLDNHGARIGATTAALLDPDFRLRSTAESAGANAAQELAPLIERLVRQARVRGQASDVTVVDGQATQVVLVPVKAPVLVGWVLLGLPLSPQLASEMQQLSALHLSVLVRPAGSPTWQSRMSTLPAEATRTLSDGAPSDALAALRSNEQLREVMLQGEDFGVRAHWLSGEQHAGGAAVLGLVSISVDEAVRTPAALQLGLLLITALGVVVFAVGSVFTARHVVTPLQSLAAAAERLGEGDYATPMGGLQRNDEIGELAHAFERMRVLVAEKQNEVLQLAYWDPLTGLPNRARFRDAVRQAIEAARSTGSALAVVMLDLDRFKHVNDVLGYRFGDLMLSRVAERLKQHAVRNGDLVARLGGDEFAVLLRGADAASALTVARRIAGSFDDAMALDGQTVDMGAGIGLACWPQHADEVDNLLSRAEVAMYTAKRRSDGPLVYDSAIDASSAQTLSLLTELRHAVEHHELRLYLQPKLALATGVVEGAECLMRWQHPQRGMVPPMQFIPYAEQTGFIRVLTLWLFEEAARQWLQLMAEGLDELVLAINLSTRDLMDTELPAKFDALLLRHQVPAEAFCLEITESAIMDDPQRAQATLERLASMGFKLSIDDFGTGYSSLAYLKRLPVDELKIDKSFVMGMERDADDAKIVRSTIDLAHNLGLRVVAEGVENAAVWDMLRDLQCDTAQGFHMGKPMPVNEFCAWSLAWATRQGLPGVTRGEQPTLLH
jgi:diguanylate cyclase (GGDEF)-like protein